MKAPIFLLFLSSSQTTATSIGASGVFTLDKYRQDQSNNRGLRTFECPHHQCTERPSSFEFQFLATSCESTTNFQNEKYKCLNEQVKPNGAIRISETWRKGAYVKFVGKYGDEYFSGWVRKGDTFRFNNKGDKFPADMRVSIFSSPDEEYLLQSFTLHTSCSKNLFLGDIFASVKLVGLYYRNEEDFVCDVKSDEPSSEPSLMPTISPTYVPSALPSIQPSTAPSAQPTLMPTSIPTTIPSPLPKVIIQPPAPGPLSFCEKDICRESPLTMTFAFLPKSGKCSSSQNTQNSKFQCSDFDQVGHSLFQSEQFYILFYKGNKKNKKKKSASSDQTVIMPSSLSPKTLDQVVNEVANEELYFRGSVVNGEHIEIRADAGNPKEVKIPADMTVQVYSAGRGGSMRLVQSFTFHSSCSQNLFISDTFGSIELVGLKYKDGTEKFCK